MQNSFEVKNYFGSDITEIIPALASLRIQVFKEYPYLYDGTLEYESDYLKHYANCEKSLVVVVKNDSQIIGASTAMPLIDYGKEVSGPFENARYDVSKVFYFGESVLEKQYRGLGFGKRFFTERENWAKHCGASLAAFCAVDRSEDNPYKPVGYKPLNAFWQHLGYQKQPDLKCYFSWKEHGDETESEKSLTFWTKSLEESPR